MDLREELKIIKKTDSIIDNNPELKKASEILLNELIKDFEASGGGIMIHEPLEKKLKVLARRGRIKYLACRRAFKRKKIIFGITSLTVPIILHKKSLGVIYLYGLSDQKESRKALMGVESILDGRFNYEHDSLGLKRIFSRYIGEKVMKKVLQKQDKKKIKGEKHNCSILFVDINNFTKFSNKHSPEKIISLLNKFFGKVAPIALENEGTIDKLIGDEMMVIFGSPIVQKDHALRAIKTAKKMLKEIKPLLKRYPIPKGGLSIGISTGRVIVGNIGFEKLMDYTAIGKKVNLAAKLTSIAKRNEILVDETTMKSISKYKFTKVNIKIEGFEKEKFFKLE